MANQCQQFYVAQGQGKLQAHYFTHRNFLSQNGRNSRLADVDGVASNHSSAARVYTNADFQLEPGMAASFHRFLSLVRAEWAAHFHAYGLPDLRCAGPGWNGLALQIASNRGVKASAKVLRDGSAAWTGNFSVAPEIQSLTLCALPKHSAWKSRSSTRCSRFSCAFVISE